MKLRSYQEDIAAKGVTILKEYNLLYLAIEVRVGKTITSLYIAELFGAKHVLFVTKKKAIGSIEKDSESLAHTYQITITNYEQLHNFSNEGFDLIIVDEAHSLGQYPQASQRTNHLKVLAGGLPIIYLSGTPTPESYSQIYHQFWISSFSPFAEWTNFYKWAKDFISVKKKYLYNRELNDYSDADLEKIEQYTKHLFITFTQQEAGFVQEVQEEVIHVKMKANTYWLANKLITDKVHIGREGEEVVCDTAAKLMQKLHQVFSGTVIIDNREGAQIFDDTKARFIRTHFEGQKIAVFYKFKAERDMLIWTFAGRICETPEHFNSSGSDAVFISQFLSGREGINLSTADALVMFNIDFPYLSYAQTRARLQSKDRAKEAKIYWIFSESGIEDKIYARVLDKSDYTLTYFKKDYAGNASTGMGKATTRTARLVGG